MHLSNLTQLSICFSELTLQPAREYVRPAQFGGELGRIGGCSRSGLPKTASEARKVIGANMCFRREVLRRVRL